MFGISLIFQKQYFDARLNYLEGKINKPAIKGKAISISKSIIICFSILFLLQSGCKKKIETGTESLNEKLKFEYSKYVKSLNHYLDQEFDILSKDTSIVYLDTLKLFYQKRKFQPVFVKSFEENELIYAVLNFFDKAKEQGLESEDYHFSKIVKNYLNAVNDTIQNPDKYDQLALAEIYLTDGVLQYAKHLRYGVVYPKKIFEESYNLPAIDSSKQNIFEPLYQSDIIEYLQSIQPKSERYLKLQQALSDLQKLKEIEWTSIQMNDKKIEVGNESSSLLPVIHKLIVLGYLDTAKIKLNSLTYYDSSLVEPIRKFQRFNGLIDDGIIGKSTIDKLNISPEEKIKKVKMSLERIRWYDYSDTSRYLLVNIPDFMLFAFENKKELFNIKVCTGIKRSANYKQQFEYYKKSKKLRNKPDDWETPTIYSRISYLVLNPTWTVPASIIREEILREVKKDSNYLQIKNFKVYRGSEEIDLNEVKIKDLASEDIPFRIVQDPGAGNALGKIKFMFNNPFGIYLHDTPTRPPFNQSNRAVSHGCVRVEKPLKLAEFLLNNNSPWNLDFIKLEIGQAIEDQAKIKEFNKLRSSLRKNRSFGKTTDVVLDKTIPLFIDYYTAWVDENGDLNIRDDVYNKDKILAEYLFKYDL